LDRVSAYRGIDRRSRRSGQVTERARSRTVGPLPRSEVAWRPPSRAIVVQSKSSRAWGAAASSGSCGPRPATP
jgi:hypothetical protein